ncbi:MULTISPECIES: hypothetical protein [unclassified Agrobacterium]|uniref:hypothetical protein n=1 Tax=unclassified Agrobacterium TaxID=2632611 RepID=UPI0024487D16|nr:MULTISPECIES: hypothetical protein [unclassified Agrobacterium]MDH0616197.1 hypothetical protein [Agrobacterium sp. GD03872]MDH0698832.1 hypothetical protein [Agrobacterium sp. GD03871]MDH1060936.1 hypothetical protein [Agrobacterium sp. GD03992]MDH2211648.1 hypothetical protein [Agrobacterium sp. GD03643]MDH2221105.1 hypothetical protein [Agrobacterium sp. GD03638]
MAVTAHISVDDAVAGIGRILDRPPEIAGEPFRDAVRVTNRWGHGALHDSLPALPEHVIMTYYGVDRDIVWRTEGKRLASRTRSGTITLIPEGHDGRWDIGGSIEVNHVIFPITGFRLAPLNSPAVAALNLLAEWDLKTPVPHAFWSCSAAKRLATIQHRDFLSIRR